MMEKVAAVYGWPPSEIDGLRLDELAWWAEAAEARLEERAKLAIAGGCAWRGG
jgi:hypothetical protein